MDSVGEGEGGMFQENSIETCILSRVKQITSQVGCMRQVLRPGTLGRPRGSGWRGRWEGGSGWRIHVYPRLIHVNVWQKPLQYCKVISLQLIKINKKRNNIATTSLVTYSLWLSSNVNIFCYIFIWYMYTQYYKCNDISDWLNRHINLSYCMWLRTFYFINHTFLQFGKFLLMLRLDIWTCGSHFPIRAIDSPWVYF